MNPLLDVRTIMVMSAVIMILLSVLLGLASSHAKTINGAKQWAIANLFLGIGLSFAIFFDHHSAGQNWAKVIASTLIATGISLQFTGIQAFKGLRRYKHLGISLVMLVFLNGVLFSTFHGNFGLHALINSLLFALMFSACALELFVPRNVPMRNAYWFTGVCFTALAALMLIRAVAILNLPLQSFRLYDNFPLIAPWLFSIGLIVQLCVIFGFILLISYSLSINLQQVAQDAQAAHQQEILARQEAEQANAVKTKFLAAVSHDLRQPIHAQGLFLGALKHTKLNEQQRIILENANAASKSTVEMLNILLDYSRIEAGVVAPHETEFHLQPLLNKIESEFASQADNKQLIYRSRETSLAVYSDPMLVELIVRNLITNAIRYTERGGILLACRKRGKQAVIEVWDSGIGIAPENHKIIFDEFSQLGNFERDRQKGLGLGLAIVRNLVIRLKLELSLSSRLGRGSVFRLFLPLAESAAFKQENIAISDMVEKIDKRVLVIDDDTIVLKSMHMLLSNWGCLCDTANSIDEALDMARNNKPDFVICDYRLRDHHTGVEAIEALRDLLGDTLPVIMMTGDTAPDQLLESVAISIPVMHKPVSPDQLYLNMMALLQRH